MSLLEDIIGTKAYEQQKELGKLVIKSISKTVSKGLGDKKEDLYVLQKKVIADIQKEVEDAIKAEANKKIAEALDLLIKKSTSVPFLGTIIALVLRKRRNEILKIVKL